MKARLKSVVKVPENARWLWHGGPSTYSTIVLTAVLSHLFSTSLRYMA